VKERVFRYRAVERSLIEARRGLRVLDVGCGRGDNLARLSRYGGRPEGLDPSLERAREARSVAPAVVACGESIPWRAASFDLVYISHVLHHARAVGAVLDEAHRVLAPDGQLFVVETIEDSPLMRLARRLQPRWEGDDVLNRFRYADLLRTVDQHGFTVRDSVQFNWMYWAWELLPIAFRPFELFTPLAIGLESALRRPLARWGAHCWLVAERRGAS
jgi:ubiquinone/menaquinone biosynthesis C-methylase UbiE